MPGTNEILVFGDTASGGNILSQAVYASDPQRNIGHQPGIARQELENKVLRQVSLVCAAIAQMVADNQANNIVDTLTPANLATYFTTAVRSLLGTITVNVNNTATGFFQLPIGTTAQRPTPAAGMTRYNSTLNKFEGYSTAWGALGGGAVGGGPDLVFYENDINVENDYTITSGKNALSAGPITISSGVTVTVPVGSTWTVI